MTVPTWLTNLRAKRFGGSFLLVSIVLHLLFGVGATVFIVQRIAAKRQLAFQGGPPAPSKSQKKAEHQVQVQKQKQQSSAPAPPKRIAVTGLAKVTLPELPTIPVTNTSLSPMKMTGMGGSGGFGLGPGALGAGNGTGKGGGGVPSFGLRETTGSALKGTFYDLKQGKDGKPTEMGADEGEGLQINSPQNSAYKTVVGQFIKGGMSEGALARFFQGPTPLYATQVFIPSMSADHGPQAFNLAEKVKPKRWIVVYRGNVTPPESGNFRFVGFADDVLAVRFNGRVVLEGSLVNPSGLRPKTSFHYNGTNASLYEGDTVSVSAGNSYPLEVVIGEQPGGQFNAFLLLEKIGTQPEKSSTGSPLLPIFKLAGGTPPPGNGGSAPEFAPDTPWSVWKGTPSATSGGNLLDLLRKN